MEIEEVDCGIYSRLQESSKITAPEQLQQSLTTLQRLLQNIQDHPEEAKYRSIKRSNKAIQSRLLSIHGMLDILNIVGFRPLDSDTLSIISLDNVDTALVILQAFEAELKDSLKTEEEKDNDRRQLEIRRQAREKEEAKKRLLQQAALDRQESKIQLMPTQDSHAINRGPGQAKTFKDIGVDLNVQKKG
jgi:uncharacterized protein (DUF58 family)